MSHLRVLRWRASRCAGLLLGCALVGGIAAPARADTTSTTSVSQLMVLEPGDTSYKLFHGAIWLDVDKATTNYRWGGQQCKGRDLSDSSVQLLFAAFRSEYLVKLEFVISDYKDKQYRCVTGFTVSKS